MHVYRAQYKCDPSYVSGLETPPTVETQGLLDLAPVTHEDDKEISLGA